MKKHKYLLIVIPFFCVFSGCSTQEERQPSAQPIVETSQEIGLDSSTAIYRQFFFSGTHNSYSGNLAAMKREGICTQLESGLRFFEFDLFPFHIEEKVQLTNTSDDGSNLIFEDNFYTYLLSYKRQAGEISIFKIDEDQVSKIDQIDSVNSNIEFSTVTFQNTSYVFSYNSDNGILQLFNFENDQLQFQFEMQFTLQEAKLSPFVYDNNLYLGIQDLENNSYSVYQVNLENNSIAINQEKLQLTGLASEESLVPFVQSGKLYFFSHNQQNVTRYKVISINTNNTWAQASEKTGVSSELLNGKVMTNFNNEYLYICSYKSNGDVKGAQLIIDNGKPNLIEEYFKENLPYGSPATFASTQGQYLWLESTQNSKLFKITTSDLAIGHDAPGDEVDLSVDNPSSILLEDWIAFISNWSNSHPGHEPLFIMTELKNYNHWVAQAKWEKIITLFQDKFGEKLRYHSSLGFRNEPIVAQNKIVDGQTLYFMDENANKENGLLGKIILYIQPNNNITKSEHTNNFKPYQTQDGQLQENFMQLKRYRESNKLVSPDWRYPSRYGNDLGSFIESKDNSYISRIFHMENPSGNGQYNKIRCANVMFAVSDRPFDQGSYSDYIEEQKQKNNLEPISGCN